LIDEKEEEDMLILLDFQKEKTISNSDLITMSSFDHSVTSTGGEKLLSRSMTRVKGFDDGDDIIVDVHKEDDTIATMQLVVVLYQVKNQMNQPFDILLFQSMTRVKGFDDDDDIIADVHKEDDTIATMQLVVVLYQVKNQMNRPFDIVQQIIISKKPLS
jgi:intein-encoded DNA endonuclease-like protein